MQRTIAIISSVLLTLIVATVLGWLGAMIFGYGYGFLANRLWPLMPEEGAGPQAARGMAIFVFGAVGFLTGWSLGLMTWSATWRRAKAIASPTSAHR